MVANFKYKIMIYWQDVNIIFDYPINPKKVGMLKTKKSLCTGAEWPAKKNQLFFGIYSPGGK